MTTDLMLIANLLGTFVFALSGAVAAMRHRLDLFGVLVLSFAAANSGGIVRDLLIGAVPPVAISDWRYLAAAVAAGLISFRWAHVIERLRYSVKTLDAAGLALDTRLVKSFRQRRRDDGPVGGEVVVVRHWPACFFTHAT